MIKQAVIAIGGKAARLKADGVEVSVSKSFVRINGRAALEWCLLSLHIAGIQKIIICYDDVLQMYEADRLLDRLSFTFANIKFFNDSGLGVHGLPWHIRNLLDASFIFECGHSVLPPDHYRKIMAAKSPENIVVSAFYPHEKNLRQPVMLKNDLVVVSPGWKGDHAVAHPFVCDREYASRLPSLSYNIHKILSLYSQTQRLRYVFSSFPPEFDQEVELRKVRNRFKHMGLSDYYGNQLPREFSGEL